MTSGNDSLDRIADEAGEWFILNRTGELSLAERQRFVSWLEASPVHVQEYLATAEAWQAMNAAGASIQTPVEELVEAAKNTSNVVALDRQKSPARRKIARKPIFPYNPRSVGAAFRRACKRLKIKNLHFHDLRHEGTSRLFEAGLRIEQVALVTGHRDWKMLKRYTHLRPEHLRDATISIPGFGSDKIRQVVTEILANLSKQNRETSRQATTDDDMQRLQTMLLELLQKSGPQAALAELSP